MSSSTLLRSVCLVAALSLGACSQPEGPAPRAEGEVPNRIGDITRDLLSVAGGDAQAPSDLADDVVVFVDGVPATDAARDLADKVARAIAGKQVSEDAATQLARQMWTAAAAREFNPEQVEALQEEMKTTLASVGASEPAISAAATEIGELQAVVTTRQKRWYEIF